MPIAPRCDCSDSGVVVLRSVACHRPVCEDGDIRRAAAGSASPSQAPSSASGGASLETALARPVYMWSLGGAGYLGVELAVTCSDFFGMTLRTAASQVSLCVDPLLSNTSRQ